jgi:penicillin-binding protein 2
MKRCIGVIFAFFILLLGCTRSPGISPSPSLSPATSITAPANLPDPSEAAQVFLDAWRAEDYPTMYGLLTSISRDALSQQDFTSHYQGVAEEAVLSGVDYEIRSSFNDAEQAQVNYRVILHSALVGDIHADTHMNLSLENDQWRVQWDDTLVMPHLKGDNYLAMTREGYMPSRGNIYDRFGQPLVAQADATAIGLYPDQIDPTQEEALFAQLSELIGLQPEAIKAMYANYPPGAGWYLPLGEVPAEEIAQRYGALSELSGLVLEPYKARYYFNSGDASHLVGYMGSIPEGDLQAYQRKGYQAEDRVGLSGLELWGEPYLAGKRGGALYVLDAQGRPVTRLAESPAEPAEAIYTTIDRDFQEGVEQAIAGFRGAAVVLERDTGRVLAMASSPGFDPNAFEPVNFNSDKLLAELNNPDQPLFNRAAQGQYPLGSVFKIITMAAAMEQGGYTTRSTYYCDTVFNELAGLTLYDWTYEYKFPASGTLTLPGGLIRSCNPWFYHIGLDMFNRGLKTAVTDMGRGFGLGSQTGIQGVEEAAGQVPYPESEFDATNLSIGQGALLVTPLQVADFIAAIGNGGTLYRPQMIERIVPLEGEPSFIFKPEVRGSLPISAETLSAIQAAMQGVVSSTKPRGTAYHVFTGLDIPVAGKTGTAQTGLGAPHAWFAGYTSAGQSDKPDIALAVVLENTGEGSDYAAPVFRRIVELYYYGIPGKLYEWESFYNLTSTPSTDEVATPSPAP